MTTMHLPIPWPSGPGSGADELEWQRKGKDSRLTIFSAEPEPKLDCVNSHTHYAHGHTVHKRRRGGINGARERNARWGKLRLRFDEQTRMGMKMRRPAWWDVREKASCSHPRQANGSPPTPSTSPRAPFAGQTCVFRVKRRCVLFVYFTFLSFYY